jgi:hypothetical protein
MFMTLTSTQPALTAGAYGAPQLAITAEPHWHPQPLATLDPAPGLVITILNRGSAGNGVVLAQTDGAVSVLVDGQVRTLRGDADVLPITERDTELALARQAVTWALAAHRAATDRIRGLYTDLDDARRFHDQALTDIRAYAIRRHRDGDICRDGLNEFLTHFDLDPYRPRHRVQFTIRGSFEVTPDADRDTGDTEDDVRDYLRIDTDEVDGVIDYAVDIDVTVDVCEADDE